ncbi:peptidoglycan-binding domain-containing protein [Telmatospirillum sp. J64-1]|uniref:peptidoglycan-binding domain-containing protein n=1 Tax=Telmatospirillum sp. J64-1 TaxID=2502183 RepID=UPI00115EA21F|nr:peptidoglycan-binding domain-containing protein [Telmatospirillum sp. J64-1]
MSDASNGFRLRRTIGTSYNVEPDDVLAAKNALTRLGHYQPLEWGLTPWPDNDMFKAIKDFQKKQGLKVDGLMRPGGPTEEKIARVLSSPMPPVSAEAREASGKTLVSAMAAQQDGSSKISMPMPPRPLSPDDPDEKLGAEFKIPPSVLAGAGKVGEVTLESMRSLRDAPSEEKKKAWDAAWQAAQGLEKEAPEMAKAVKQKLIDYRTNPDWAPELMSDAELAAALGHQGVGDSITVGGALSGAAGIKGPQITRQMGIVGSVASGMAGMGELGLRKWQGFRREDERKRRRNL